METLMVAEHFVNGLRRKPRANTPFLDTCYGMRCTTYGLLAPKTRTPQALVEDEAFPFPQLARLDTKVYHFAANGVYIDDGQGDPEEVPAYTQVSALTQQFTITKTTAFTGALGTYTVPATGVYRVRVTLTNATAGTVTVTSVDGGTPTTLVAARAVELGEFEFYASLTATHVLTVNGVGFVGIAAMLTAELTQQDLEEGPTQYEFARFGDVWLAKNNKRLLVHAPMTRNLDGEWLLYSHLFSTLAIDSLCAHNGMLLLGGFDPEDTHFDSSDWSYIWQNWVEFNEVAMTHRDLVIGRNVVMYSRRAGGDYWSPFEVELAMLGIPGGGIATSAQPFILDAIRKKELGFFLVPTAGSIVAMRSLGDRVVIFCTDGVYAAVMAEGGWVCERVGDHIVHAVSQDGPLDYLTRQKKLYRMTSEGVELVAENTGLTALNGVVFGWDAEEGERYISDDASTFLLTPSGLSKIDGVITSVLTVDDDLWSYESGADLTTIVCSVVTETLDFGDRMLKLIHDVSLKYSAITNIYCRVQYRTTDNPAWRYSPWFLVKESGFTVPIISGHDIRVEFKFNRSSDDAQIEYTSLGWRASDKRNFRLHSGGV